MSITFSAAAVMIAVLAVLIVAAAVFLVLIWKKSPKKKNAPDSGPLPGGGGSYIMQLDGVNCEHCRANAEAALNAFEGICATVDLKSQRAKIVYTGYPDLELLDRLREAVEKAGFTVKEIR